MNEVVHTEVFEDLEKKALSYRIIKEMVLAQKDDKFRHYLEKKVGQNDKTLVSTSLPPTFRSSAQGVTYKSQFGKSIQAYSMGKEKKVKK